MGAVPHDLEAEQELLADATARLVRTVDSFGDDDFGRSSDLPGWTRAHVVAHLALNAEGLAAALQGVVAGEPTPMYRSQEARDADIDELAGEAPAELRTRLMAACTEFADAAAAVPTDQWGTRVERTPGGERTFTAVSAVAMRLREVEIHHADLDAGYTRREWPPQFSALLLDAMAKRGLARSPFTAAPTDLDGTWQYGEGGPTVRGTAADLGWWLTGRGEGEGLTSDDGRLPGIEAW
jgi:maleylpyruvate isomerase